jgi:two-component system chemotaxis sensor kinase CheA
MDDLLADFLTETSESLGDLDVALLKLEQNPNDKDTLGLIFRLVHTIKGTCGFLGLSRLEHVAHAAENVLGRVRDGLQVVTPGLITLILKATDRFKEIVNGIAETGTEPTGDDSSLVTDLNLLASGGATAEPAASHALDIDAIDLMADPTPAPTAAEEAPAPAEAVSPAPPPAAPPPPVAKPAHAEETAAPAAEPAASSQTIRVAVDVLEDLMTMVSELVLTRNQLLQLARTQESTLGGFATPLQRLSLITSDLQEGVMKTRMQPIGHAWNKLPRLVRDLSHELGKKIDLVMLGADTELDRQVLELIKDPLTHMVRNSGDHGLEGTAERRAAGKPETGRITLNAYHEGGHIIIEIADDGRGLPVDRIRNKVIANGLATEAELAAMSEAQIQRFIFRAGFSTAAAVTAVSGRGVGMDVVKTNIERIGGTIDLRSTVGAGTTFTIKIPLTLAIVSALIVEAASERFAIPQLSVVELVRARADGGGQSAGIERINETPVLRLRDRLLPLVNLDQLLGLRGDAPAAGEAGGTIIVTQVGSQMLGLIVDRVFDTEEIVVKPVAPILRHISMFSGNTILGDGSVIMILDPNGIARASGIGAGSESRGAAVTTPTVRETDRMALLLFRAGHEQPMAVPLSLVARLEDIPRARIESSCGMPVTQYRGKLMPLIAVGDGPSDGPTQPVLVFAEGEQSVGLMVDEIVDVLEDRLSIELGAARPGVLGTAIIGGRSTDVLDTAHWLEQAGGDWFRGQPVGRGRQRILVVEDSAFFRSMLIPALSAAGYDVTTAVDAQVALRLREAGEMFAAIVSDINMPGMDGLDFARAVRRGGPWAELPMIALSGQADPAHVAAGRDAGFTDYVAKFDRDQLVVSLGQCLAAAGMVSA